MSSARGTAGQQPLNLEPLTRQESNICERNNERRHQSLVGRGIQDGAHDRLLVPLSCQIPIELNRQFTVGQPILTQSVNPLATKRPVATSKLPCTIEYARNGHATIRATVSAFGSVYGES